MQRSSSKMKWLGLGVLGCAACCAAPFLAMLGIGGGAASLSALFAGLKAETVFCVGVLGALLAASIVFAVRRFHAKRTCQTACSPGGGCCAPTSKR